MKLSFKALLASAVLLSLSACFWAGRWEDDSKNWKRAFNATIPKSVSVVHSLYWRTPHFTREDGWTFQLAVSPDYRKKLFEHYKLRSAKPDERSRIEDLKKEKPAWFIPKPAASYES